MKQKIYSAIGIMLGVILIDQLIKIYIKTHFVLRESYEVASWFYLSFIENNGMAYGMEIGSKLVLTLFRIIAVIGFIYYMFRWIRRTSKNADQSTERSAWFLVVNFSMIIGGAIGNIVDCIFYGRWFTSSVGRVAQWADETAGLMPTGEWLQGRVVDMFYFPLINFEWPDSFPCAGETMNWFGFRFPWPDWLPCSDEPFMFFKPVFNFADAAISVGIALLLLNYLINSYKEAKKDDAE